MAFKFEIVDGDKIVIVIPCDAAAVKNAQLSKGGKMRLLATTHGFTSVATPNGTVRLSLNAGV